MSKLTDSELVNLQNELIEVLQRHHVAGFVGTIFEADCDYAVIRCSPLTGPIRGLTDVLEDYLKDLLSNSGNSFKTTVKGTVMTSNKKN